MTGNSYILKESKESYFGGRGSKTPIIWLVSEIVLDQGAPQRLGFGASTNWIPEGLQHRLRHAPIMWRLASLDNYLT